jgi:hypothetical protein
MTRALVLVFTLLFPTVAFADSWSHTTDSQPAQSSSVRVVEPEGYQVTINGRADTVPAVFTLPNADAYVALSIVAPNGASWEKKIEVKPYRQTVVRITHKADAPNPARTAPAAKPSHVGILFNTSHLCRNAKDRGAVRLEWIDGANSVATYDVPMKSRLDVKLAAGEYSVRVYAPGTSGNWEYRTTVKHTVSKDGWNYEWGCAN